MSKKRMKQSMRIGLAVVSALLALQVTTGRAFASVEIFTVDSLTRQGISQITVSGTVQFSAGDLGPQVFGTVTQFQRGQVPTGGFDFVFLRLLSGTSSKPSPGGSFCRNEGGVLPLARGRDYRERSYAGRV